MTARGSLDRQLFYRVLAPGQATQTEQPPVSNRAELLAWAVSVARTSEVGTCLELLELPGIGDPLRFARLRRFADAVNMRVGSTSVHLWDHQSLHSVAFDQRAMRPGSDIGLD